MAYTLQQAADLEEIADEIDVFLLSAFAVRRLFGKNAAGYPKRLLLVRYDCPDLM